jgi:hypothetical protein
MGYIRTGTKGECSHNDYCLIGPSTDARSNSCMNFARFRWRMPLGSGVC